MRIYLAARYSRRLELCGYRDELRAMGHTVQAIWLDGEHQIDDKGIPIGENGEALVEMTDTARESFYANGDDAAAKLRQKFAQDDFRDVLMCDMLISFTEPPRSEGGRSRGGRHIETGIALGMMKRVWVVGYRENIFHWLDDVRFFETWDQAKQALAAEDKS